MNYAKAFTDWVKGNPLDYLKPEQRRALPMIVSGAADEEQLDAAGASFVLGIKEAAQFSTRATVSGPIDKAKPGEHVIPWVLSDESPDRMGDVISADGWALENFKRNPVVLWGHGGGGVLDGDEPIGRAMNIRLDNRRLVADLTFAVEESERAARKFRLANSGYIKAGSVGFKPTKVDRVEDEDDRKRLGLGKYGVLYKSQELLEFSLVAIPANPHALQQSVKTGEITEADADWLSRSAQETERDMERIWRKKAQVVVPAVETPAPALDAPTIVRELDQQENLRKLLELIQPKENGAAEARLVLEAVTALRSESKALIVVIEKALQGMEKAIQAHAEASFALSASVMAHAKSNTDLSGNLGALRAAQPAPGADAERTAPERRDNEILQAINDYFRSK